MPGTVLRGDLTVKVDPLALEASLLFNPNPNGTEWTSEAAIKLMANQLLSPLPTARALEEHFIRWAASREQVSVVVVRGTPDIPTGVENVEWEGEDIPPELQPLAEETLSRIGPPELFRVRTERVKRESIVKKPSSLPFLPPKEESLVTWEQKEIRDPVYVNANVLKTLYAVKGQKLGVVYPPKPGKNGKNVYGKTLVASQSTDTQFHVGANILRERTELTALASGIVRVGANWADIVPLAKGSWRVFQDNASHELLMDYEPADRRLSRPAAREVLNAAEAFNINTEDLLSEDQLDKLLERSFRSGESLLRHPLLRPREALAAVEVSSDKLKAVLHLRKAVAGAAPLTLPAISEAIKNSGVKGFKPDQVKAAIMEFYKGPEAELSDYILFEGRAPERGADREIQPQAPFLADSQKKPILKRIAEILDSPDAPTFPIDNTTEAAFVDQNDRIALITQPPVGAGGTDVFGKALPGLPGNDPHITLMGNIRQSRNDLIAEITGLLLWRQAEDGVFAQIRAYRDGEARVSVSKDGMTASISLTQEEGPGIPLSEELVQKELKDAGVLKGIDTEAIRSALAAVRGGQPVQDFPVAWGQAAVAGGGSSLNWLVARASGKAVQVDESGQADFKNQDRLNTVQEGTPIAEIIRYGVEGKPGWDVYGASQEPSHGNSVDLEHDDSIAEEAMENGVRLIAKRTGELCWDGKSMKISAVYAVKGDIGVATGNIKFPGDVKVGGKVCPGFAVISDADVLVQETVEGALISAGGKAVVGQGVIGAGKGIIRARKGIDAGFVEQATLLAVEDIRIKNGCLQSSVKTNGKLRLLGERGHLIGGTCRARQGVECANLGSERGTHTEISFGQDYLIMDQIEATDRETEKLKDALTELERRIKLYESASADLSTARAEKVRLLKRIEQYSMRLFMLREKFEEHHESDVRIRGAVFPGVVLESHGRYFEIKQKKSQVRFVFERELGCIQEKPLK